MKLASPSGLLVAGLITCVMCVLLACAGLVFPGETVFFLATGWAWFVYRASGEVSINWPDVALALAMLAAFTIGMHRFASWLYGHRLSDQDPSFSRRWQVRWTASVVALTIMMFVAGTSMVGVTHQLAWMLSAKEPIVESSWREFLGRIQSHGKLREYAGGFQKHNDLKEELPRGVMMNSSGEVVHGWHTQLLPYIEQQALYDRIALEKSWNDPVNGEAMNTPVSLFLNPRVLPEEQRIDGRAATHYAGNPYILSSTRPMKLAEITDGAAMTALTGEAAGDYRAWGHPFGWRDPRLGINRSRHGFGSPNGEVALVLMCDGSVRQIPQFVKQRVLEAIFTPAGGDTWAQQDIPPPTDSNHRNAGPASRQ